MSDLSSSRSSKSPLPQGFATTHWSVVIAARGAQTADRDTALAHLCHRYWYPLYFFVRRQGYQAAEAQDLTQEFFAELLARHYLDSADQQRGRFRTFLLTVFKRFLSKQRRKAQTQKRGGGRTILSIDFEDGERRFEMEPADTSTPEQAFERKWALTLLERVLDELMRDFADKGKADVFEHLSPYLTSAGDEAGYAGAAEKLNISPGAVKVAVSRLRKRYGDLLRQTIAETVADQEEVDDEIDQLLAALRSDG